MTECFVPRLLRFDEEALSTLVRCEGVGVAALRCRERHVLARQHLRDGLQRFVAGRLDAHTFYVWADCFEAVEWIDYEDGFEEGIADGLFQISTPEVNGVLTSEVARRMLIRLQDVG